MIRHIRTGTSVAASLTGYASNVTGATFTLSATTVSDGLAHLVTVRNDSATDHSAKTLSLLGTDADGRPQTETMAAPGTSATVTSLKYWLVLTSITPSATIGADTFDIGYAANAVSPTIWPTETTNKAGVAFNIGVGCSISGSPTYTVQHTYDGSTWFNHATIAAKTVAFDGSYTSPVAAVRLLWTAAGTVTMTALQVA